MRRIFCLFLLAVLSGCSAVSDWFSPEETVSYELNDADYATFAKNVTIAKQGETFVEYEYKNIRVDDLAVLAALYCHDHNNLKAHLDKITLYHNNARHARFVCK